MDYVFIFMYGHLGSTTDLHFFHAFFAFGFIEESCLNKLSLLWKDLMSYMGVCLHWWLTCYTFECPWNFMFLSRYSSQYFVNFIQCKEVTHFSDKYDRVLHVDTNMMSVCVSAMMTYMLHLWVSMKLHVSEQILQTHVAASV